MAELIENPTRGSDPRERDSTPQNLQSMPAKAPRDSKGWGGLPGYRRKRARLAGRLPNGVTLSALIMKVDTGRECCFAIPRVPGTFFLRAFVESFEFPDSCETLPEIAKLGWAAQGFLSIRHGLPQKEVGWFLIVRRRDQCNINFIVRNDREKTAPIKICISYVSRCKNARCEL